MKKFKLLMVATITSMLITSCGSDSGGGGGATNFTGWGSNGSGNVARGVEQLHNSLEGYFPCSTERVFMSTYLDSYQTTSQTNGTGIIGNLKQGAMGGETGDYYAGANGNSDILIIAKTTNGNNVGFNYYFSFCGRYFTDNQYGTGRYPLLAKERGVNGIQMTSPSVLTATAFCPTNVISAGQFYVYVPQYTSPNGVPLQATALTINFAPPGCQ